MATATAMYHKRQESLKKEPVAIEEVDNRPRGATPTPAQAFLALPRSEETGFGCVKPCRPWDAPISR